MIPYLEIFPDPSSYVALAFAGASSIIAIFAYRRQYPSQTKQEIMNLAQELHKTKNDLADHKAKNEVQFTEITGKLNVILEKIENVKSKVDDMKTTVERLEEKT